MADYLWAVSALAMMMPVAARAYIAAGDRDFAATLLVPQIAPSDAFWGTFSSYAQGPPESHVECEPTQKMPTPKVPCEPTFNQTTTFEGTYSKTITERLGIQLSDAVINQKTYTRSGNVAVQIQYELVLDQPHEFVLSAQAQATIGGTGAAQVGQSSHTAYQPAITFGKGFGDVPVELLRPFAVTGFVGYQFTGGYKTNSNNEQPNAVDASLSLQYSFPYLVSKVTDLALPDILRDVTPITELQLVDPRGHHSGSKCPCGTGLIVAPGVIYSPGNGFEFGIEAEIPSTKAAGKGIGVIGQLLVEFDYLFPESILGHPLFH